MSFLNKAIELLPIFRERVWGRKSLAPYFPDHLPDSSIGEVWYTFKENQTSLGEDLGTLLTKHPELLGNAADTRFPGMCPILVKLLFTTERLSVQVHPDDVYAQENHGCLGKTEAWYVLDSVPPGEVAVGFKTPLASERLAAVAQSGEIADLLDWRKVKRGDVIFTPAGTVHAIGAGLTICEIQENSDITYRLYDYGRPRELHLEHGAKVSHLGPHEYDVSPAALSPGRDELAACDYFRIERLQVDRRLQVSPNSPYYLLAICVRGSGTLLGRPVSAGQAWFLPAHADETVFETTGSEWIITYSSEQPATGLHIS
jgi:mannose-6-phosphate isomerase